MNLMVTYLIYSTVLYSLVQVQYTVLFIKKSIILPYMQISLSDPYFTVLTAVVKQEDYRTANYLSRNFDKTKKLLTLSSGQLHLSVG